VLYIVTLAEIESVEEKEIWQLEPDINELIKYETFLQIRKKAWVKGCLENVEDMKVAIIMKGSQILNQGAEWEDEVDEDMFDSEFEEDEQDETIHKHDEEKVMKD